MDGIVVGVDESPPAMHALRWALDEARLRDVPLHVVTAWEFPFDTETGLDPPAGHKVAGVGALERSALEELDKAVAGVGGPEGVVLSTHVFRGSPVRVLLDAAEGADLLAVGSRGRGGFAGLLLGSVSRECIQHALCPVVVVR